ELNHRIGIDVFFIESTERVSSSHFLDRHSILLITVLVSKNKLKTGIFDSIIAINVPRNPGFLHKNPALARRLPHLLNAIRKLPI
ncbi:hypothetical protein, partial [Novipirellula sp.]|uniref:hypothetical protein n=1 Tax=Novipirellula sp. TaxID=2795430 RepID=UPI00356A588C